MRLGVEGVKTGVIVTVLATLTWALAESQTLRTEAITIRIALEDGTTAAGGERGLGPVVRVAPGQAWDGTAELSLNGSTALIDDLVDRLRGRAALTVGREVPADPGVYTVALRDVLRNSEAFRASGVSIESAAPESVQIEVDQLETRDLPLRVQAPEGVEMESTPTARPQTARITAPRSVLASLGEGAAASATLEEAQIAPLLPGRDETVTGVRVTPPAEIVGAWSVRVDPGRADAVVRLRSKSSSLTIPRVPVQVMLAPSELGRWVIEVEPSDQDLIDVVLTGPQEQLDRIQRREVRPTAFVALSFEELEAGVASKRATIVGLPAGVRSQVARDEVRLSVQRADIVGPLSPGSPGGGP